MRENEDRFRQPRLQRTLSRFHSSTGQMWALPRSRGLKPNYGGFDASKRSRPQPRNEFDTLVDDIERKSSSTAPCLMHTDVRMSVALIDSGASARYELAAGRQLYVLQVEGASTVSGARDNDTVQLERHEALRVTDGAGTLTFAHRDHADGASHVLVVDVAATR